MNYAVTWHPDAVAQLISTWIRSAKKDAVTGYVEQIDRSLGRDPYDHGESRNENTRIEFFRPLCVRYHVDEAQKAVTVLAVKWVGL